MRRHPPAATESGDETIDEEHVAVYVPARFLSGGIIEELTLRFGLMSVLAYLGWRITGRRADGPQPVVGAVLFGLGHLPALAQSFDLTPALITRTVLLNASLAPSSAGSIGDGASR